MLYQYLKENYIPGEPIFTGDIDIPGMTEENLRYHLKKLTDSGSISLTGVYLVTFSIVGPILGPLFDKYNLHRKNLSRMLEDTGTVFSPIIHGAISLSLSWEHWESVPLNMPQSLKTLGLWHFLRYEKERMGLLLAIPPSRC